MREETHVRVSETAKPSAAAATCGDDFQKGKSKTANTRETESKLNQASRISEIRRFENSSRARSPPFKFSNIRHSIRETANTTIKR